MMSSHDKNATIRPPRPSRPVPSPAGTHFFTSLCFSYEPRSFEPREPESSATAQPGEHHERTRILIVDDHDDTGRALKRLLKRRGYEAEYVTSGREAVDQIRRGDVPQLVILDVMMPDMSGIETLEEMKKSREFDETPVVMYSASEDPATMRRAFSLGARDYILKGSDWDEMIRRIDTALPS